MEYTMSSHREEMQKLLNLFEAAVAPAVRAPKSDGKLIFEIKVEVDDREGIMAALRSAELVVAGLKRNSLDKNRGGFIKDVNGNTMGTWGMRSADLQPETNDKFQ